MNFKSMPEFNNQKYDIENDIPVYGMALKYVVEK